MKSLLKLKLNWKVLQILKNPNATDKIFDLLDMLCNSNDPESVKVIKSVVDRFLNREIFGSMYRDRYSPKFPTLDELKDYPQQSFGYKFYEHMRRNNLDPNFFPEYNLDNPLEYINFRINQTHDYYHVLFNYDTSVDDEIALQAVNTAQYKTGFSILLIAGGLLNLLQNSPGKINESFERVVQGYQRGTKCKFLLEEPLESMLKQDILEVRKQLNIYDEPISV